MLGSQGCEDKKGLKTDPKINFKVTEHPSKVRSGSLSISSLYRFGGNMTLLVADVRTYKHSDKQK